LRTLVRLALVFLAATACLGGAHCGEAGAKGNPMLLVSVVPGSLAERSGLRAGDSILEFNGRGLASDYEFSLVLAEAKKRGLEFKFLVLRAGEKLTITAPPTRGVLGIEHVTDAWGVYRRGDHQDPKWDQLVERGVKEFLGSRWAGAAEALGRAAEMGMADPHVLELLGRAEMYVFDYEEAIRHLRKALAAAPSDPQRNRYLGSAQVLGGHPTDARKPLSTAVAGMQASQAYRGTQAARWTGAGLHIARTSALAARITGLDDERRKKGILPDLDDPGCPTREAPFSIRGEPAVQCRLVSGRGRSRSRAVADQRYGDFILTCTVQVEKNHGYGRTGAPGATLELFDNTHTGTDTSGWSIWGVTLQLPEKGENPDTPGRLNYSHLGRLFRIVPEFSARDPRAPTWELKVVRQSRRYDFHLDGERVIRTYGTDQPLRVRFVVSRADVLFRNITVMVPGPSDRPAPPEVF
jgi:hypothetical protein